MWWIIGIAGTVITIMCGCRFARDVAEAIAPRGMVPTYFIEFDLKGHRASALSALTEEQKAALGL